MKTSLHFEPKTTHSLKKNIFILALSLTLLMGAVFADELDSELQDVYNNAQDRLENIKFDIQSYTKQYKDSKSYIEELEEQIVPLKEERISLQAQLELFEEQITLANTKIQNVEIQVNQRRLEIANLQESIESATIQMEEEQETVFDMIRKMYAEERQMYDDYTATPELVKMLLDDESVSHSIKNLEYLTVMEKLSRSVFHRLEESNMVFLEKKNELEEKNKSLSALKYILEQEKANLLAQKEGKQQLFEETKGREDEYQRLIAQSKEQEREALVAVANLRENQTNIEEKLNAFDSNSSEENQAKQKEVLRDILNNPLSAERYDVERLVSDIELSTPLTWPVSPEKGISAYFQDASYKKYFGVPHQAIDIRVSQGTPIFAPASAYVEKVKDNGMGYSYIILAHKNGLSTLYGHVSEIDVEEGQLIQMGTIIGKSGATPGTKGAGTMTTGPHLHFEVFKNGEHVNPLDYLPLQLLPEKYRPN